MPGAWHALQYEVLVDLGDIHFREGIRAKANRPFTSFMRIGKDLVQVLGFGAETLCPKAVMIFCHTHKRSSKDADYLRVGNNRRVIR